MLRPAVFLDRDGVLNQERGYLRSVSELELIPGAAQAVRALNARGLFTVLVSNQSGPARGYYSSAHVEALHARLEQLLQEQAGARLDVLYFCPSLSPPEGGTALEHTYWSTWRKPNTGMLVAAAWQHDLDLARSYMVGDKATDVDLARNAGCRAVMVRTGFGEQVLEGRYQYAARPDYLAGDLWAAAGWILDDYEAATTARGR